MFHVKKIVQWKKRSIFPMFSYKKHVFLLVTDGWWGFSETVRGKMLYSIVLPFGAIKPRKGLEFFCNSGAQNRDFAQIPRSDPSNLGGLGRRVLNGKNGSKEFQNESIPPFGAQSVNSSKARSHRVLSNTT